MTSYRLVTIFETLFTHERETKVEYTADKAGAVRAYGIYLENPEVVFCTLEAVTNHDLPKAGKIIAIYNRNGLS